jgi:hypothetical protein
MTGDKSIKTNDRERAFVYLRAMTDEKGKKARIALAGAFGEMLNRVFDRLEGLERASHDVQYAISADDWTDGWPVIESGVGDPDAPENQPRTFRLEPDNPYDLKVHVDLTPGGTETVDGCVS